MEAVAIEEMLKLLIQGLTTISDALQVVLLHYQNVAEDERMLKFERSGV